MKASDIPYVLLGLSILALVASFSIWQTIRQRRSAQTAALNLHGVIESIARALNMRLDDRSGTPAIHGSGLPGMKAVVRDHATTIRPKLLAPHSTSALSFSISIAPRPGSRWVMPSASIQPDLEVSEQAYLSAKRDKLAMLCPTQESRLRDLFAPRREPLRVVAAHIVSGSISVDLQPAEGIRKNASLTASVDSDDLRRIVEDLVSIAEALPSQPA